MAETTRSANVKVGLTALVGLAILIFGIMRMKGCSPSTGQFSVVSNFPSVGGLQVGDPVYVNGVRAGDVQIIEPTAAGVMVHMRLDHNPSLHSDATATIAMLELMGGKKVDLSTGSAPGLLASGTTIPGSFGGDIGSMVTGVYAISSTITGLAHQADTLTRALNTLLRPENRTLFESTLVEAKSALHGLQLAANDATRLMNENGPLLHSTLASAKSASDEVGSAVSENRAGVRELIDTAGVTLTELRQTLNHSQAIIARADTLLAMANNSKTVFSKLMKDERFGMQLDTALSELTRLAEQIRKGGVDANIRFFHSSSSGQ